MTEKTEKAAYKRKSKARIEKRNFTMMFVIVITIVLFTLVSVILL